MKIVSFFLVALVLAGCTNRGVYEGIQESNRNKCFKIPLSQYDKCIENANKSFDEYERERKNDLGK